LLGSKKRFVEDPARGQIKIETPDMRTPTTSTTLQIHDGATILMRADFRPMADTNKDTVRLVLARPYIWIPAEMVERGVTKVSDYSKTVWEDEPAHETSDQSKPDAVPATDKMKEILRAVLEDVLYNPQLKKVRDFYGTPGNKKLVLADGNRIAWPRGYKPEIPGFELVESKPDPFSNRPHLLGIRPGSIDKNLSETELNEDAIEVQIFNAGGSANGVVCGSVNLSYSLQRVGKKWIVKLELVPYP
jgi:hypothetical protein